MKPSWPSTRPHRPPNALSNSGARSGLVAEVVVADHATAITAAAISMGLGMQLNVVAEGVEESAQADQLLALGCTLHQGYLYSRPLEADQVAAFLAAQKLSGPAAGTPSPALAGPLL